METLDMPVKRRNPELGKLLLNLRQRAHLENRDERRRLPGRLVLTNQAGLRHVDPPWELVEGVVRGLDEGGDNHYCILDFLTLEGKLIAYIQTLRGPEGMVLERRRYGGDAMAGFIHLRASYPGGSHDPSRVRTQDGTESCELRDLICLDDVVDAFHDFYRSADGAGWLEWRPHDVE